MQEKNVMARIGEWHRRLAQVMAGIEGEGRTQQDIIERALEEYARNNHDEIMEIMPRGDTKKGEPPE